MHIIDFPKHSRYFIYGIKKITLINLGHFEDETFYV